MKQKIFLIIGILLLSVFGITIYNEFIANHAYYFTAAPKIVANWANRKLFLWTIVAVGLPLLYIIRAKIFSVKRFFMFILPVSLLMYTTIFVVVKDTIIGGSA